MSFAFLLHVVLGLSAFAYLISLPFVLFSHFLVAVAVVSFISSLPSFFCCLGVANARRTERVLKSDRRKVRIGIFAFALITLLPFLVLSRLPFAVVLVHFFAACLLPLIRPFHR